MEKIHSLIVKSTKIFEIIISISIIIAILLSLITVVGGLIDIYNNPMNSMIFKDFLGIAFNIIIGVEFLKMIFRSNLDTVIEILLFAIARQLIVEQTTVFENGIGVISIGILFVIRKFLFVPKLDCDEKDHDS